VLAVNKRRALASLIGVLIVGGVGGLAVTLEQSHARNQAQLRLSAENRASLAASLLNSVLSGSYRVMPPADAPLSGPQVTSAEIDAARRASPITAVFGSTGALLASYPALAPSTRRLISSDPAVAAGLTDGRHHLSSLLHAAGGVRPGFLDVAPYRTRFGTRETVTWLPLPTLTPVLDRYLSYVAHFTAHQREGQVFLLDGNNTVIGSASGGTVGRPLRDQALTSALDRKGSGSRFGPANDRFFAATEMSVAPWTVVYTIPTSALYAGQDTWSVSVLLLVGFGAAAVIALALLIGLLANSDKLARANAALGRRNERIESATEAKSRFVASLSHELRTPLNAVIGFAELMQAGRAGRISQTQREYLGIVRTNAGHLLSLINEALDLATIEAGEMRLQPQAVEPAHVAAECVASLRELAGDSGITIDCQPSNLGLAMLDPGRLRQVILNFLSNAIKFSRPGGRVTVTLAREDQRLTIAVRDQGIGIPTADQEAVFEEFVQLGERTLVGSGLGLAVTRQIVEAQGGGVGVHSEVGAGSTFTAWLPWLTPELDPPDRDQAPPNRDNVSPAAPDQWSRMAAGFTPTPAPAAANGRGRQREQASR
jgi:signal transduction histidine kinase